MRGERAFIVFGKVGIPLSLCPLFSSFPLLAAPRPTPDPMRKRRQEEEDRAGGGLSVGSEMGQRKKKIDWRERVVLSRDEVRRRIPRGGGGGGDGGARRKKREPSQVDMEMSSFLLLLLFVP